MILIGLRISLRLGRFSKLFERADLVSAHEVAVALDICCEYRDRGVG
jgi:hypothetical protein